MKFLIFSLFLTTLSSLNAQVVYKDTGLPVDTCPVKNVLQGTIIDVMSKLNSDQRQNVEEPNAEGCLTLKSIYINNLISSLEQNLDQSFCDTRGGNCKKGSEIVSKTYAELVAYLQKTQKADVLNALKNDRNNSGNLIINQVQNLAALRYRDDSPYDLQQLAKVNANIKTAFNLDLNLRPKQVDAEKTKICMDRSLVCPMQMSDPARATEYCKNLMKQPYPAYCTAGASGEAVSAAMVSAGSPSLSDSEAEEYLNLNLDVKKAFENKSAKDTRGKTQYASDHYRDFAEAEGRPVSVKEYLNCNPDVGYAFNDPAMNTNQDEAKTNIVAFVAKHFQYLIQPIVPVSSRNFKTHGCIDVEKYLLCHEDVRKHCTSWSNGDRDVTNKIKICAMNHYKASGQKEGRTDSCSK